MRGHVAIKVNFKSANPQKFLNNYLICSILILISFNIIASIPKYVPDAFGQLSSANSTAMSNSSGQFLDFKIAASQGFISPLLLVPIDAVGDDVYFAWSSNKTGNFEVFFTRSTDNGKTIENATNLSNSINAVSEDVSLEAEGDNVYVSWWENYENASRIPVYIASNDNGRSFGEKVILGDSIK
jgi:hypothetical protein